MGEPTDIGLGKWVIKESDGSVYDYNTYKYIGYAPNPNDEYNLVDKYDELNTRISTDVHSSEYNIENNYNPYDYGQDPDFNLNASLRQSTDNVSRRISIEPYKENPDIIGAFLISIIPSCIVGIVLFAIFIYCMMYFFQNDSMFQPATLFTFILITWFSMSIFISRKF